MLDAVELAIFSNIERADPSEGLATSWGAYAVSVGNINPTILLDLTKELHSEGFVELRKWVGGPNGWARYDDQVLDDDEFFFRGEFRLRLTTKGRRRLAQLTKEQAPSRSQQDVNNSKFSYDVAISFAGEQRPIAEGIAKTLSDAGISVFYDKYEQATLWGINLYDHLTTVYQHKARYCLILASKEYASKVWTTVERQSAQARALKEKNEYILPVRIDDTEIPGILPTVGYLSFGEYGVDGICGLLQDKLGKSHSGQSFNPSLVADLEVVTSSRAFILTTQDNVQAYIPVVAASWSKVKAVLTCEPDGPTDGPFLDALRTANGDVFVAFRYNVGRCRVEDVEHQLHSGKDQWRIQLRIEETDFAPSMEVSYNNLSADQIATQRARRILLDEKRPARSKENIFDDAMDELFVRGREVPIQSKSSPFPALYKHYGHNPTQFLEASWITGVFLLKTTGVVEEVTSLKLSLIGRELKVAMRGKRRKQYTNQPPAVIAVEGTCGLMTGDQ